MTRFRKAIPVLLVAASTVLAGCHHYYGGYGYSSHGYGGYGYGGYGHGGRYH